MRVRHDLLITGDYPPRPGGQARYLESLWGGFTLERATVLAPQMASGSEPDERGPAVKRVRLPLGEGLACRLGRTVLMVLHAVRLSYRLDVTAVHAGQLMAGGTAALVCHYLWRVPYSVVVHGADMMEFTGHPLARRLAQALELLGRG